MRRVLRRRELLLLAAILLAAVFFRTFRLPSLPRGMTADEGTYGLEALAIAQGEDYPVFLSGMSGALPMYAYWIAILFRFFGANILTARTGTALVGIATVPVFYLFVKELFASSDRRRPWSLIAVLATSFLATSYWHVVYSRLAIEPILVPLLATLVLYCLVRAWRSGRRAYFLLGGLFLGLGIYTYPAAYFLPVLVVVLLGYYAWRDKQFLRIHWINLLILFGACSAIVAPLGLFAITHPEIFMDRPKSVSILNPEFASGSPLIALATSSVKTAAMFVLQGDTNLVHNPASRPVLDLMASVWFILGLCAILRRWREPAQFMLLMWLVIMCLPGVITAQDIPHFSRTIGVLPVTCILPAIGMVSVGEWFESRTAGRRPLTILPALVFALTLLFTTAATYENYFLVWDTREDLRWGYDGAYTEAAMVMNQTHIPDSVWILPVTPFVPSGYGADHFDFLYHGDNPYYSLSLDEARAPNELSSVCQNRRKALVLDWKEYVLEEAYTAISADPKGLVPFLLDKYGLELDRRSYEAFDLAIYELPESPAFLIADKFEPVTVSFGDELTLTGIAFGGSSLHDTSTPEEVERRQLPSGKSGWVALRWRAMRAPSRNYKIAVYLEDEGGHIAGQVDKLLLSNHLHRTGDWQAGQEETDYFTLRNWGGTAPGLYKIGVTAYDAESAEVMQIAGVGYSYELGMMEILRPLAPEPVEPEVGIEKEVGEVVPGIRLVGYDLPRRELNPGDELSVALYWQSLGDVKRDYLLAVELANEQGAVWAEEYDAPVYGSYPTLEWTEAETLKDWHDLSLPSDMPQGSYQVSVLIAADGNLLQEISLERVSVRGRPHHFTIPEIQHTQEATLGEGVQFLGYGLSSTEVRAGGTVQVTLYWRTLEDIEISYTVFTHLLDTAARIWGQMDSIPGKGAAPTTSWLEGEIITDEYEIVVDQQAPPGEYVIEIGMYDASTGVRLPVLSDDQALQQDRLLLGVVQVVP